MSGHPSGYRNPQDGPNFDPSNSQHDTLGGDPRQNQPPHQSSDGSMPYGEGYDASQQPSGGAMGYSSQGSYEGHPQGEYGASMSQNRDDPSQNENRQPRGPLQGPPWYRQGPGSQAIPQDQWNNIDSGVQSDTMGHDTGAESYDQQGDIPAPPGYPTGPGTEAISEQAWIIIDSEPVADDPGVTGGPHVT